MAYKPLTEQQLREHERYQNDLRYFCRKAMKIKLKEGGDAPFIWNKAQEYLHARIEDQLARTGMVRVFIIKGRQQGISTYIAARLYHKATRQRGRNVFILSHHSGTTETLFRIVDKYHMNCPVELTPQLITSNNRRMAFENNSSYTVGTAGSGAIGRGDTNQYFHWSEVAHSENISELLTGAFQTVADVPGTEKFLESTANGVGNYFHTGCMQALSGEDEYELIFIPWYWQEEYRAKLPVDFQVTDEERQLQEMYHIDDQQLQWRRNKIREFQKDGEGVKKFKQEYPFSVKEAFQASGIQLIDADKVAAARKSNITDRDAPLILGVDPGPIHDRTAVAWRRGRELIRVEVFRGLSPMSLAGKLAKRIEKYDVAKVFVDVAEGRGVVDRLHELGYKDVVTGFSFATTPNDEQRYVNKRAEMMGDLKEWIEDDAGVSIPDVEGTDSTASADEIEIELGVIPEWKVQSNGKLLLIPKEQIKKSYGKSPDLVDSIMLTFAQPVRSDYNQNNRAIKRISVHRSELTAINRRRRLAPTDTTPYDDDDRPGIRVKSAMRRHRR